MDLVGAGKDFSMGKVLYIDYENVQKIDLSRIAQLDLKVWLFAGSSQNRVPIELVKSAQALGNHLEWVLIGGNGPNALDFHIAYYLGLHVAVNPEDEYFILSKDKGFDPLVGHVMARKTRCRRIVSISEIETDRLSTRVRKAIEIDPLYAKVVANLAKLQESKRPRNRKTLRQHVKSLAGKGQSEQKVEQIVEQLFASKVVMEGDDGLSYKPLTT
jgi:hypothetical protein